MGAYDLGFDPDWSDRGGALGDGINWIRSHVWVYHTKVRVAVSKLVIIYQ